MNKTIDEITKLLNNKHFYNINNTKLALYDKSLVYNTVINNCIKSTSTHFEKEDLIYYFNNITKGCDEFYVKIYEFDNINGIKLEETARHSLLFMEYKYESLIDSAFNYVFGQEHNKDNCIIDIISIRENQENDKNFKVVLIYPK